MALLLDTNALLWLLDGDERLGSSARTAVEAADGLVVSVASLWEIAIKVSLGKLEPVPALPDALTGLEFTRLDIADTHLAVLQSLPLHHRDPFDRLLVSQATAEGMAILTSDRAFGRYPVDVVDARR
ncbi:MAG: type II toxin-antitoxin system VapC family toxin [Dermatophilaceae bacterium]